MNKLVEFLSNLNPINAALAFCLYTNKPESILELARNITDPSPDWVRILANASDTSIIDEAIYDLFTTPGWAELLADPQYPPILSNKREPQRKSRVLLYN